MTSYWGVITDLGLAQSQEFRLVSSGECDLLTPGMAIQLANMVQGKKLDFCSIPNASSGNQVKCTIASLLS